MVTQVHLLMMLPKSGPKSYCQMAWFGAVKGTLHQVYKAARVNKQDSRLYIGRGFFGL